MSDENVKNTYKTFREQLLMVCGGENLEALNNLIKTYRKRSDEMLYVDTIHFLEVLSSILDLIVKSESIELIKDSDGIVGVGGVPEMTPEEAEQIQTRLKVLSDIFRKGENDYAATKNLLSCEHLDYIGKIVDVNVQAPVYGADGKTTYRGYGKPLRGKLLLGNDSWSGLKVRLLKKDGTLGQSTRNIYVPHRGKVVVKLVEDVAGDV